MILWSLAVIELHAAVRPCLRGARAMVLALVTVIDYFSDVVGFASKGAFKAWARKQQSIARSSLAWDTAGLLVRGGT